MQNTNNQNIKHLIDLGFDFNAIVKVDYDGMKGNKYPVHEIVGTRVTIQLDRQIDFNINEVELMPISYNEKEYQLIQSIK
jgi:hypothetical protein